jgi:hypothetical protein
MATNAHQERREKRVHSTFLSCADQEYRQKFILYLCTHPKPFAHLVAIGGAASYVTGTYIMNSNVSESTSCKLKFTLQETSIMREHERGGPVFNPIGGVTSPATQVVVSAF